MRPSRQTKQEAQQGPVNVKTWGILVSLSEGFDLTIDKVLAF
jgi:hypothetical protein